MLLRNAALVVLSGLFTALQGVVLEREAHWNQDLAIFAKEFPSRQIDFDKLYSREAFNREIVDLKANIGNLSNAEITLRLMRVIASAHVGHNSVYAPLGNGVFRKLGLMPIPLTMAWYADGLAIVGGVPRYKEHFGTRVLKIGSMTPEQALPAVASYIGHENETALRQQSPGFLQLWPVLRQVGAVKPGERLSLTLSKPGGEPYAIDIADDEPLEKRVGMYDVLPIPIPLSRKSRDRDYWYEYLPDSSAVYVQYNDCTNDPKLPFGRFAAQVLAEADAKKAVRFIIDLRLNGGGDSRVIGPLIGGLRSRPELRSHLRVLIGPSTFSSAQMNAIDLRDKLGAILVGQPTGEKLDSYGEVRNIALPNSGLQVQYTTKFFHLSAGGASSLEPSVSIAATLEDALAGRDPVLSYALTN